MHDRSGVGDLEHDAYVDEAEGLLEKRAASQLDREGLRYLGIGRPVTPVQ